MSIRVYLLFCFKQETAYELRISDWSSDVCSSDLHGLPPGDRRQFGKHLRALGRLRRCHRAADHPSLDAVEDRRHPEEVEGDVEAIAGIESRPVRAIGRDIIRLAGRSEERRVGKECVSTCRSRWSPYP